MLRAFGLLLACQLLGEVLVRLAGWPVPGPVMGLILLVAGLGLAARLGKVAPETVTASELGRTSSALIAALGILFVPAGAGVVQHFGQIAAHGAAIAVALVVSTILTLTVTAAVFVAVRRAMDRGEE
ncbi:MAG TPA: CidA/LrgA family protein [Hyphomicrobiales bacterium]|nr:CidA/LrgA family protein [Hyphomicrobiales bacterium]